MASTAFGTRIQVLEVLPLRGGFSLEFRARQDPCG